MTIFTFFLFYTHFPCLQYHVNIFLSFSSSSMPYHVNISRSQLEPKGFRLATRNPYLEACCTSIAASTFSVLRAYTNNNFLFLDVWSNFYISYHLEGLIYFFLHCPLYILLSFFMNFFFSFFFFIDSEANSLFPLTTNTMNQKENKLNK